MTRATATEQTPMERTNCPYCRLETVIVLPDDYAPVYVHCSNCNQKFIAERLAKGFQTFSLEAAPRESDPDCRALEMCSCDEQ
jgi:transcription elongation factor Elf1